MTPKTGDDPPESLKGLRRIHEEMLKLTEAQSDRLPYNSGASLTTSDFVVMKTVIDPKANSAFWRPADQKRSRAMENALNRAREVFSEDLETFLDNTTKRKIKLTECTVPTVSQAYEASFGYSGDIEYFLEKGLFHNEDLVDSNGDSLFRDLRCVPISEVLEISRLRIQSVCYIRSYVTMETRTVFGTPGYPHITIFSIQPHRASSQKELLCTEFWTLHYWAKKFGPRTTGQYLPVSSHPQSRDLVVDH